MGSGCVRTGGRDGRGTTIVSSHAGHDRLKPVLTRYGFSSVCWTAAIAPWNPIFECVPSQKGFVVDPPQRQSAAFMTGTSLPCASTSLNSPSTTYGPLSLILMVIIGRSEYRILCSILDVPLVGIPGELDRNCVIHDDSDLVR